MFGFTEKMFWTNFLVLVCCAVCIYCENVWNDVDVKNDQVMSDSRRLTSHYQHNFQSDVKTMEQRIYTDQPSTVESSVPFGAVDRKYVRRTNLRRRKISSSNNKKNVFRRGQRHRLNKNGFQAVSDMDYNADADSKDDEQIIEAGLWPAVVNVAPRAILHVNGTCGQQYREDFCHTIDAHPQRQRKPKCSVCDSHTADRRHPIEYVIDGSQKWWQSPTLNSGTQNEYITITMDLKQNYQVLYVSLKAAISPRPASWILERSFDGVEFIPWQYFGVNDDDCRKRYNLRGQNEPYEIETDDQIICSTQFSKAVPLENGEIQIKLLEYRPGLKLQVTPSNLLDFTLARYLRIRLQGMHTTLQSGNGIQWIGDRKELNKRSFYSLKYIKIGARLDCNGHALRAKEYNDDDIIECECAHNTCGINCEKCCPLYNQKPYKQGTSTDTNKCEKCECYGHSNECYYNPEVDQRSMSINTDGVYSGGGVCLNCTDLTTGINCERCITNYYRPYGVSPNVKEPCVPCECNPVGTVGTCASIGGACTCKPGFAGKKCSECAPGYSGANCSKCACDSRGTMPGGECEAHCQCKLYVEGELCDRCSSGYFGLSESNAEGCTKCYCSGVGNICESSNIVTNTYETLEDWKITDISRSYFFNPSRDNETGFMLFNMYEMTDAIYWLAPDLYGGNKLQSYGSNLVVSIAWDVVRGDTSGKPTFCPTMILIGDNGMKIGYGDTIFSDTNSTISIQLTEHGWYHIPTTLETNGLFRQGEYRSEHVTRSQFLAVLSSIESVMIRGSFHTDQADSILIRASLEFSKGTKNEARSNLVEQCTCPQGYIGLSCETCDFGYVRAYENTTSNQLGICLPCSCNGHSETCDLSSNKCSECKHNTTGERCESCAPGFYGNAKLGTAYDCKRCGCPLIDDENNFSPTCQLRDTMFEHQNEVTSDYSLISYQSNDYVCTQCPEGYVGDHCESCSDGYYGVPTRPNSKCLKCPCNGGPCDPISGKCITCQGNTVGWRCEQCKVGYFGNPGKGCEICRCLGEGSVDNDCDIESGQCKCKVNYDGYQCDECAFGYANVSMGCPACNCNSSGSIEKFCDTHTGQCPCKMGVEGLQCDECVEGFYGLSTDGCQECHCNPLGSTGQSCNKRNGQCLCRDNVTGRTCDKCSEGFWNLESANGCQSCACNAIGSHNFSCNAYTGQCNCKAGVGGPACDSCLEGFYGFSSNGCKRCDECSNSAYNCDVETGHCICPPNSKGSECNQCMPNSYGWEHKKGCKLCGCDYTGSIGQSCDLYTGQCLCREGFTGQQCTECAVGYFGYPKCERCGCNRDGSIMKNHTEPIPCNEQGQCSCKSLVTGAKCDECVQSTFGLSEFNTEGCTRCFCFGRSNECMQSDYSWGVIKTIEARCLTVEYQNIEYISLQSLDNSLSINYETNLQIIDGLTVIPGTTGNVSMKSSRGFETPLYFEMPKQFLGDRLMSYGGLFKFNIEMMECKTELDQITVKHFPLIRIHAHKSLTLDYFGPESFETNSNITQTIRMTENYWRMHPSGESVSRGIFMAALQNVTYIMVRGASSVAFTSLTLSNVTLETAIYISGSKNNLAIGVETCQCPEMYDGASCQNPADGYYRYKQTTTDVSIVNYEQYIGKSVLCECNGRSNRCDKETGYCEFCANNSGGVHCEVCADGFYGEPEHYGCQSCPCPETHRNFAKGCTFQHGRVSCSCRVGYAGDFCDSCAPGFFGTPDQEGGGCIDCQCNPHGSISNECDGLTGECMCREGIAGKQCDKCLQPTSILEIGGCQVCDNCTLTLLESSNDLADFIQTETRHIDLDTIPAPWSRLMSFENSSEHLIIRLDDITKSTEKIENYNDLQIDKLSSKVSNLHTRWQKMLTKATKRSQMSDNLRTIAITFWNEMEYVQNETQAHINTLNVFGIGGHHVNLPFALAESQQLLKSILSVVDSHNVAHRAHQCAVSLIDQWSNTSSVLSSQMDESHQLKYDIINAKNRLYDLIQNVYKTSETITNAKAIHAANSKSYGKLLHHHHQIMQLHSNINDIYKSNVIPETDTVFNIIIDNHQKLRQDLSTIIQLKTIIRDVDTQSTQQMNNIRQEWMPQAENHSNHLMSTAREYVGLFQNTKNSAEAAMLASTAYKNITNCVSSARELTANARQTAIQSENELYPKQDESILEKSTKSLKKSQKIHQHSLKEMEKMEDLEFSLKSQWRKVDSIKNTIWQTGLRNNNLSLTLNSFSKNDTQEFLKRTIEAAERVSEQMREVRRGAIAITGTDIYKLKLKLASLEPQWAVKFGLAEENVSQSMRNIKDIKNTLSSIETTSKRNDEKFRQWNQTMSVLMQDLKNKIAKARHIADGIRVSLASKSASSKCVRSFALPTLGLATANTIKLSVALNTKLATTPLIYMEGEDNRFLAIEMVKRKIRFIWNLGGDTVSITHPMELHKKDLNYDEAWYQIEANRTMNVGHLIVRQMGTGWSRSSSVQSGTSRPESTRITFTPNKRLWIGGVPDAIRPQELLAHDAGLNTVLSNVYIDEKRIGLWNFMHTEGECDGATLGAREITALDNARHFNGQGYSVVKKERSKPYKKNFFALQLSFKTLDENALLFLAIDEKNNRSISLTLYNGRIMFRIDYGGTSKLEINTSKKYNTGRWTSVEVAREFTAKRSTENGNLKVNNEEPLSGSPTTPITSSLLPDLSRAVYYLGGIPPDFKSAITKAPGADNAYLGCMKDIQINGETYDPLETSLRNGVEASCRDTITRAGFYGNGYLELPNHSLRKRANVGFAFRTLQADALILLSVVPQQEIANNYYDEKDLRSNYSFSLENGRIVFWADAGRGRIALTSNNTLNDGEYHTVNVLKMGRKFELRVDDEYQMSKSLTTQPFVINMIEGSGGFYVGGIPNVPEYLSLVEKVDDFQGSLKDFVVNNQSISFGDLVNSTNVDVGRDGPKMGRHEIYNEMLMKTEPISKSFTPAPEGCHRVGAYSYEPNAFKFGDTPQSHSIINIAKHLWQTNFEIQFDFRTFYPNGLLFFVPGTKDKQKHFFTLILRNGQLNVVARGRKRMETIMSRKLNDGRWQRITLKCVNKLLTIRIQSDGNAIEEDVLKMPRRISATNMMYIGGIVDSMASFSAELTSKMEQFKGCIRRFMLNNVSQDLARPGRHFAIGQCFPNVEKGSYFAGDAYAVYKRIFNVGKYLELRFEFRTSELHGMILSVAEPVNFPAISIELHKGKIIMSCDLGDGHPFRVESNVPSQYTLCDNKWHNVSAIYDSNQIAIRVDDLPSVNKLKQHEALGKVHTKSPLYIGGLPDTAPSGTLLSRDNFKGCIRNVVIRNELKDWTDMDELQNVLLSECLIMS